MKYVIFCCILATILGINGSRDVKYDPTWESLDKRPLPEWYDDAKVGIFIHWGVYAVPSLGNEWFWEIWQGSNEPNFVEFMKNNYRPGFTYQDFARDFTVELFKPDEWAELFKAAGAKYVVLTSKHHDGYALWPSAYSFGWNSKDLGAHRDLVGELAESIRATTDIHFGLYHSLYEWFNPIWLADKASGFNTTTYVTDKIIPEMKELVLKYKPEIVWSDGEWEAPDTYWSSTDFLAWLYNESPVKDTVVSNDRWGSNVLCKHGGFLTCSDRYNPGVLQPFKWENAMTIDKYSWGFRKIAKLSDYLTTKDLVDQIAKTISCNGNILINVGPTKEGTIDPIFEERLRTLGSWLKVNGEAVYGSRPWIYQNDTLTPNIWFTKPGKKTEINDIVYAFVLNYPEGGTVDIGALATHIIVSRDVTLLGNGPAPLPVFVSQDKVSITLPPSISASDMAWVLKIYVKSTQ